MAEHGRLRTLWDRYRHLRAALGLVQDVLGFFGWKKTLGAFVTACAIYVADHFSRTHLAGVELFVLSLGAFAFALVILNIAPRVLSALLGIRWPWSFSGPTLEFGGWHAGTARGYPPNVHGLIPSWVSVRNAETEAPETAKNVTASLEWTNPKSGARLPTVPEAEWYERQGIPGRPTNEGWKDNVTIEGGDDQSLVFTLQDFGTREK